MDVARIAADLHVERERLLVDRVRLVGALGPEDATGETVDRVVREIEAALGRITDGVYGTCARCGASIPDERLAALPYATRCMGCAEQAG